MPPGASGGPRTVSHRVDGWCEWGEVIRHTGPRPQPTARGDCARYATVQCGGLASPHTPGVVVACGATAQGTIKRCGNKKRR